MDSNQIKHLLEKYFEGETTLAEEQKLKQYFEHNVEIPTELRYAQGMFVHFKEAKTVKYSRSIRSKIRIAVLSAAAVIAILFAISTVFNANDTSKIYCYIDGKPITDKKIAQIEMNKALALVNRKIETGTKNLDQFRQLHSSSIILKPMSD